jgi:hypothetical protein
MRITVTGRVSVSTETETPTFSELAELRAASQARISPVIAFVWADREIGVSTADPDSAMIRLAHHLDGAEGVFKEQLLFASAAIQPYVNGTVPAWV